MGHNGHNGHIMGVMGGNGLNGRNGHNHLVPKGVMGASKGSTQYSVLSTSAVRR
jgi:hypothetical protein